MQAIPSTSRRTSRSRSSSTAVTTPASKPERHRTRASVTSTIALEVGDGDVLVGVWISAIPFARFDARQPALR